MPTERTIDEFGRNEACELLGVAADAAPDERCRVILEQLDRSDYEMAPAWHDAVEIVFGPVGTHDAADWKAVPALRDELESGLSDEIEAFAARYFAIESLERTRTWSGLIERAKFSPVLSRRLGMLQAGLNLVIPDQEVSEQERLGRLIGWARKLFPLPPTARYSVLNVAREEMQEAPQEWEVAADSLLLALPEIAGLVPDLLEAAHSLVNEEHSLERCRVLSGVAEPIVVTAPKEGRLDPLVNGPWHEACRRIWAGWSMSPVVQPESRPTWRQQLPAAVVALAIIGFLTVVRRNYDIPLPFPGFNRRSPIQLPLQRAGQPLFSMEVREAAKLLPADERDDLAGRLKDNRKLTVQQLQYLERHFQKIRRDDLLHALHAMQFMARAEDDSIPLSGPELRSPTADQPELEAAAPRPAPPDLPEPDGGSEP